MNSKTWLINGFAAIVTSILMSVTLYLYAVNSGNLFANVKNPYFIIVAGISQILFYGGIIGVIIGFIKLFNETKR
jgi:hypothetical protein